jgi:hypothetical protein
VTSYRIEKEAVEVRLALSDGSAHEGRLWFAAFSPNRSGPQTVADLAAEPGVVLPFQHQGGRFLLVGKPSIASVTVEAGASEPGDLLTRIAATVVLAGGHQFRGHLLAERGAGDRPTDLLNATGDWIRLEDGGRVHWIAKRHILTVEPEAD